jgi:hypothetical protein
MKHIWSIICSLSSIDYESNNVSLLNCLEQLNIQPFKDENDKTIPILFEVVSLWRGDDDEFKGDVLLELFDPNGKKLKDFPFELIKPRGMKRLRTRIKINSMPFTGIGDYIFKLKIKTKGEDYKIVSEIPLEVQYLLKI